MASMRRILASPILVVPLVTALILLSIFLIYYLPATSRQAAFLNDRAFRTLGILSDQIQARISNFGSALRRAPEAKRAEYFADQVPELQITQCTGSNPLGTSKSVSISTKGGPAEVSLVLRDADHCAAASLKATIEPFLRSVPSGLFDEIVLSDAEGGVLAQTYQTGMRYYDLSALMLAPVADGQTGRPLAGASEESKGKGEVSGVDKAPGRVTFFSASQTSGLFSVSLGGTEYWLYLEPVALPLLAGEKGMRSLRGASDTQLTRARLVIGGLIQYRRIRAEGLALPIPALLGLVLVLFIVVIGAWPLLKFSTMRASELVRRRAGLYYAASTVAMVALVVVMAAYVPGMIDYRETDRNLAQLGEKIDGNVAEELRKAQHTLEYLANRADPIDSKNNMDVSCGKETEAAPPLSRKTQLFRKAGLNFGEYPYFDLMVLSDQYGFQRLKWTVRDHVTPQVRLCELPQFTESAQDHFWYFQKGGPSGPQFRVDPIYSPNTGEYLAVLTQRYRKLQNQVLRTASLVGPLLSLVDPIMPPQYGFAMVDSTGEVLFHANPLRNGRENFFQASRDDRALESAVFVRQGSFLNFTYLGVDQRAYVTPLKNIADCPWTLIVFRDLSAATRQNVQTIMLFLLCVLIYLAFAFSAVMILVGVIGLPHYPPEWIWPREKHRSAYYHLIAVFIAVGVNFLLMGAGLNELLLRVLLIPLAALLVLYLKLTGREPYILVGATLGWLICLGFSSWSYITEPGIHWLAVAAEVSGLSLAFFWLSSRKATSRWIFPRWKPPLESVYTMLALFLLLLIGIFPCLALFKLCYGYEQDVHVRTAQLQTVAALEAREQRVKQYYYGVSFSDRDQPGGADPSRWLFLRRRLSDEMFDRYDSVFLAAQKTLLAPRSRRRRREIRDGLPAPADQEEDEELPVLLTCLSTLVGYEVDALEREVTGNTNCIHSETGGGKWRWTREGVIWLRLHSDKKPHVLMGSPQTFALLQYGTGDPQFLSKELVSPVPQFSFSGLMLLCISVLSAGMFWWLRPTIVRLFTTSEEPLPKPWTAVTLDEAIRRPKHLILVGMPRSGKSEALAARDDIGYIDVAQVLTGGEGKPFEMDHDTIVLDNFDYHMGSHEADEQRLKGLNTLLSQTRPQLAKHPNHRQKIVLITTIDPLYWFSRNAELYSPPPEEARAVEEIERLWESALTCFDRARLEPSPPLDNRQYPLLWSTCTASEKAALYQIANEGWANNRNGAALAHLLERNLLKKDYCLQFTDEAFRNWIRKVVPKVEYAQLRGQEDATVWDGVRISFIVLVFLGGIAGLFLYGQGFLGSLSAAAGILATASKLLSAARGGRVLPPAGEGS
jgi:hypothetical protein